MLIIQDIEILLTETGRILKDPEWNEQHQNYVYTVEGLDESGEELTAIITIEEPLRIPIITVY